MRGLLTKDPGQRFGVKAGSEKHEMERSEKSLVHPALAIEEDDNGDEDDENSILRSGKQPDPPPYDHSNCSNNLHKSCACVSFIAEHTKAREEATKVSKLRCQAQSTIAL